MFALFVALLKELAKSHARLLDKMLTKINYINKKWKWKHNAKLSIYKTERKNNFLIVVMDAAAEQRVGEACGVTGWERYGARVAHKALLHTHAMGGTKDRFDFKSGIVQWDRQIGACAKLYYYICDGMFCMYGMVWYVVHIGDRYTVIWALTTICRSEVCLVCLVASERCLEM